MFKALALATTMGLAMVTGAMAGEARLPQQHYSAQEGNGPGDGIFGRNTVRIIPVEARTSSSYQDQYSVQEGNGPGTGIFGPNDHRITHVRVGAPYYQDQYSAREGNGPGNGIFGPNDHQIIPVVRGQQ